MATLAIYFLPKFMASYDDEPSSRHTFGTLPGRSLGSSSLKPIVFGIQTALDSNQSGPNENGASDHKPSTAPDAFPDGVIAEHEPLCSRCRQQVQTGQSITHDS